MRTELEGRQSHTPAVHRVFRKALAGIVLIAAVALIVKVAIGFVMAIFWTVIAIAAVVGVLWAIKTLVW